MQRDRITVPVIYLVILMGIVLLGIQPVDADDKGHAIRLGGLSVKIPDAPASGTIANTPFSFKDAEINLDSDVFTIRQGKEFFMDSGLKIFIFSEISDWQKSHETLEGLTVTSFAGKKEPGYIPPHIYMEFKEEGKTIPTSTFLTEEYYLYLSFGAEISPKMVEGYIYFRNPNGSDEVSGKFVAKIKGYREIGGKPDLSMDSMKVLTFLAEKYLKEKNSEDELTIKDSRGRSIMRSGDPEDGFLAHGTLDVAYRVKEGEPRRLKFTFLKENGVWRVYEVLSPTELFAAHPVNKATPQQKNPAYLSFSMTDVARHLEKELAGKVDAVYDENIFISSFSDREQSYLASYRTEPGKKKYIRKFVFIRTTDGWKLKGEVPRGEWTDFDRQMFR